MIDIPEPLYRRVELLAAERSETVEQFLIATLEDSVAAATAPSSGAESRCRLYSLDDFGFPVLNGREGIVVTDELVNRIREISCILLLPFAAVTFSLFAGGLGRC